MDAIPILTLKRLPQYLDVLYQFKKAGLKIVSATKIAVFTDIHMTQVRKDLSYTGVIGVPKVGHKIDELISAIEQCLNWNDTSSCFLVGVGHLGSALLGYQELQNKGLKVVAAFDTNPALINTTIHNIPVFSLDKYADLADRLHIHIGIITVPVDHAQNIADLMIANGIVAIWNFTAIKLHADADVIIENVDMSASLAVLSRRLAEKMHKAIPKSQDSPEAIIE
ncbi:MAG: redox-sensing transcriptional repressor Rex [Candidatus Cloacimonetes bacterium HGW-Cloacimonetes-3]|nr:MAG: redox-sensing transcriptional repressor Rex [Candidatus Cloacimonetes bacterium HGW-Cloacimonetes-3]